MPFSTLRILFFLLLASYLLACWGCANPIAPVGGPTDEIPPRIVPDKSTGNLQTNVRPRTIELTFDEWVKLQDAARQIVVSPPLTYNFTAKLRGRTLVFDFDEREVLRDSATYVINFGEAIVDLTEGNPAENLRFVFATGPTIDSLSIAGQLRDAYTGQPVADALLMLYDNTADSVVRTQRPFYFGRSDKQGRFQVSNLKGGRYKVAALADADRNYLYNQLSEPFGFLDTLLAIPQGATDSVVLLLSTASPLPRLLAIDSSQYGVVKLVTNLPAEQFVLRPAGADTLPVIEAERDTLRLWQNEESGGGRRTLYLWRDTLPVDTIQIGTRPRTPPPPLRALGTRTPTRQNPTLPYTLDWSAPLLDFDTALVQVFADTTGETIPFVLEIDSLAPRRLLVRANWRENVTYQLRLLPGALTDRFGAALADTVTRDLSGDSRRNYGNLTLIFTGYTPEEAYVVRVIDKSGKLIRTLLIQGQDTYTFALQALAPGEYKLEIITDTNRNGRWDPLDYNLGRQPERVQLRTLEQLRPNWDLEVNVSPDRPR